MQGTRYVCTVQYIQPANECEYINPSIPQTVCRSPLALSVILSLSPDRPDRHDQYPMLSSLRAVDDLIAVELDTFVEG